MAGTRSALLTLVTGTTFLTVITLGLYSFWARTRIRRWLWSSMRVGDMPFEYVGRPLEKLMGFVIAAVIVAIYLGAVVMLLVFASLNIFGWVGPGVGAAFGLLLPVYWFAKYRGQRYLMNHTRWRGIAFSMEPGAWGYMWLAIRWTVLSVITAGILLPLRTHRLWRYRAERSLYGNRRFHFDASARGLYLPFLPVLLYAYGLTAFAVLTSQGNDAAAFGVLLLILTLPFIWVFWRVRSFRHLASGLRFDGDIMLSFAPRTSAVVGIHLLGWVLIGLLLIAVAIALAFGLGFFAVGAARQVDFEAFENVSPYLVALGGILFYLTVFVMRGALKIAMVTFPLLRHVASTMVVHNAFGVHAVERGPAAHMADADGFANLFDLGSGI